MRYIALALLLGACSPSLDWSPAPGQEVFQEMAWKHFDRRDPRPGIAWMRGPALDCHEGYGFRCHMSDGCCAGEFMGEGHVYVADTVERYLTVCHEFAHAAHHYDGTPDRGRHDHPDFAPGGRVDTCTAEITTAMEAR